MTVIYLPTVLCIKTVPPTVRTHLPTYVLSIHAPIYPLNLPTLIYPPTSLSTTYLPIKPIYRPTMTYPPPHPAFMYHFHVPIYLSIVYIHLPRCTSLPSHIDFLARTVTPLRLFHLFHRSPMPVECFLEFASCFCFVSIPRQGTILSELQEATKASPSRPPYCSDRFLFRSV